MHERDQTIFPTSLGLDTWICIEGKQDYCSVNKVYSLLS